MNVGLFTIKEAAPWAILFACLITLGHLILVRTKHRLPDRIVLETILFLITLGLWGVFVDEAFANPAIIFTGTAVGLLFLKNHFQAQLVLLVSALFFIFGLLHGLAGIDSIHLYLALVAPIAYHLWGSSRGAHSESSIMAGVSLVALWYQLTKDIGTENPAALWAITGTVLLLFGLFCKSRVFRLTGLVVLSAAVGHLMLIDLVKLEPLPRILSFMTLGFGFLGLGFVYNRYQERLKQML